MNRLFAAVLLSGSLLCAQEFRVGSQVPDFALKTLDGAATGFKELKADTTVVMFISAQCPVSNAYNERMAALYNDYSAKGVHFIAINSNSTESVEWVGSHAKEHGFPFKVYKDWNNVVADKFGATATPETFVIDKTGTIRYHGSIDDSQQASRIKTHRLRLALDAVLAGNQPPQVETKAFGCSIKRVRSAS